MLARRHTPSSQTYACSVLAPSRAWRRQSSLLRTRAALGRGGGPCRQRAPGRRWYGSAAARCCCPVSGGRGNPHGARLAPAFWSCSTTTSRPRGIRRPWSGITGLHPRPRCWRQDEFWLAWNLTADAVPLDSVSVEAVPASSRNLPRHHVSATHPSKPMQIRTFRPLILPTRRGHAPAGLRHRSTPTLERAIVDGFGYDEPTIPGVDPIRRTNQRSPEPACFRCHQGVPPLVPKLQTRKRLGAAGGLSSALTGGRSNKKEQTAPRVLLVDECMEEDEEGDEPQARQPRSTPTHPAPAPPTPIAPHTENNSNTGVVRLLQETGNMPH